MLLWTSALARAAEPFRFPEGKRGKGELKYVNEIPVLILAGTPEEIGEQMGVLAVRPALPGVAVLKDVIKEARVDRLMPLLVNFGTTQLAKYPDEYRREFEAIATFGGIDRELLLVANTFAELRHLAGCSGLIIDPARSATGGTLIGRNFDFPAVDGLHQYMLLVVYRPIGKTPFATISFPGAVAGGSVISGMNADGVMIGGNEIRASADDAPQVEWQNAPTAVVGRRILEECATLADAEALLRATRPSQRIALVACDRAGGAVFEVTPKSLVVRRGENGVCAGTNHFLSKELGVPFDCWRLPRLLAAAQLDKLTVEAVANKVDEVNQGPRTAHTLVFDAKSLKLHLAFGDGKRSATSFALKEIDLAALFLAGLREQ